MKTYKDILKLERDGYYRGQNFGEYEQMIRRLRALPCDRTARDAVIDEFTAIWDNRRTERRREHMAHLSELFDVVGHKNADLVFDMAEDYCEDHGHTVTSWYEELVRLLK